MDFGRSGSAVIMYAFQPLNFFFSTSPSFGIELVKRLPIAHAHPIRGIGNDKACGCRRRDFQYVCLLQRNDFRKARGGNIFAGVSQGIAVQITAKYWLRCFLLLSNQCRLLKLIPLSVIEIAQLLKGKVPPQSRSDIQCDLRGFKQKRAAATHRVQQRNIGLPACQMQDPGSEVFSDWSFSRNFPESTFE